MFDLSLYPPLFWAAFLVLVLGLIALDLNSLKQSKQNGVPLRTAIKWSVFYILVALSFNVGLWFWLNHTTTPEVANEKALEFLTGYLIEKSLAIDNIFVFIAIFTAFSVPKFLQRKILIYGVLGAIIMRTVMIFIGAWLIKEFNWIMYVFGAFLLYTGWKMLSKDDSPTDLSQSRFVQLAKKIFPITDQYNGDKFSVRKEGVFYFTPLFLVLLLVEGTDLIFAVDSIPAIFAVTDDPFIVLVSNIMAILGLRAIYFVVADVSERLAYIKYGLAATIIFIGGKLMLAPVYHLPIWLSLGTIASILTVTVIVSLRRSQPDKQVKPNQPLLIKQPGGIT